MLRSFSSSSQLTMRLLPWSLPECAIVGATRVEVVKRFTYVNGRPVVDHGADGEGAVDEAWIPFKGAGT